MPHTAPVPVCAKNPQARTQKVRNDGAVNNGPNKASGLAARREAVASHPGSWPANRLTGDFPALVSRRHAQARQDQPRRRPRLAVTRPATAIMDSVPGTPDPQTLRLPGSVWPPGRCARCVARHIALRRVASHQPGRAILRGGPAARGGMAWSKKAADLRPDPRYVLHSPSRCVFLELDFGLAALTIPSLEPN
jgi:hypothetical protein